jgi:uncharacterized delta-60 repeat protein
MSIDNTFNTPNGYSISNDLKMSTAPDLKNFVGQDSSNKLINMSFGMDPQTYLEKFNISRYNTNGTLDISNSVYPAIPNSTYKYGIVDKNDKILVTGRTNTGGALIARHNVDGTVDTTFSSTGYVQINGETGVTISGVSVALDSSNNIVMGGSIEDTNQGVSAQYQMVLTKYTQSGTSVKSYTGLPLGENMYLKAMVIDSSNNIYITGYLKGSVKLFVAKFNNNLELDLTFNAVGYKIFDMVNTSGESIVVDSSGRLLVAGKLLDSTVTPNKDYIIVVRFLQSGAVDTSFGTGGYTLQSSINSQYGANVKLQLDSTGKIICLGGGLLGEVECLLLLRLNSNGQPDNTFNNPSNYLFTSIIDYYTVYGSSILIESNDKIIVTGCLDLITPRSSEYVKPFIARYGETIPPITTKPPPPTVIKVTKITLGKTSYKVQKGTTLTLKPKIEPTNAKNIGVTWTIDKRGKNYVELLSGGKIKGIKHGEGGTITVTSNDGTNISAMAKITVISDKIRVTGIKLDKKSYTVQKGKRITVRPIIVPEDATNQKVTWKKSGSKTVKLFDAGVVEGYRPGTTKITLYSNDNIFKRATVTVIVTSSKLVPAKPVVKPKLVPAKPVVKPKLVPAKPVVNKEVVRVKAIKSEPSNLTIKKNTLGKLNVIITPSNASNKGIKWTSTNNKVATVTNSGIVKGVAPGKTTITAISLDGLKVTKTNITVV